MKSALQDFEYLKDRHSRRKVLRALVDFYDVNAADIAKEAGVTKATVYNAWSGRYRNPRVEAATSRKLWIQTRELFGENGNGGK